MKFILNIIFVSAILLIFSCTEPNRDNVEGTALENKYSQSFEIIQSDSSGYILNVKDRFNNSDKNISTYNLVFDKENAKINNTIKIPVRKVICLSTTHCAFVSILGETSTIRGIGGVDYVYDADLLKMIKNREVEDVGYDKQMNYEKIISIAPDVVFAFGVDNNSMASYQKLIEIGIPVIYVGDFLEEFPLGRTEWIKFFGCFYNKLDFAVNYFDSIETNYNKILNNKTIEISEKPKVLVGLPWQGTWWVPGGNSFFANFIKDAGGNYFLGDNSKTESVPHTIEEIFSVAKDIDIWLHPNAAISKKEIIHTDQRLKKFKPVYESRIYNNNKRSGPDGGNDFWESGIVHPDIILEDLQKIFYPDTTTGANLFYYIELQ